MSSTLEVSFQVNLNLTSMIPSTSQNHRQPVVITPPTPTPVRFRYETQDGSGEVTPNPITTPIATTNHGLYTRVVKPFIVNVAQKGRAACRRLTAKAKGLIFGRSA
ncbi:hypothetical protein CVT24_006730 [Panaeolus cyanescens]|uniref:Uncharacterized protein n=1 Tax=Panaeolus cyanescens TaxID=181874 RepID=A0A409VEE1_9AGAR|nr:hypothetical protein CVT24_006730 [Panaeolus cyanescens]